MDLLNKFQCEKCKTRGNLEVNHYGATVTTNINRVEEDGISYGEPSIEDPNVCIFRCSSCDQSIDIDSDEDLVKFLVGL